MRVATTDADPSPRHRAPDGTKQCRAEVSNQQRVWHSFHSTGCTGSVLQNAQALRRQVSPMIRHDTRILIDAVPLLKGSWGRIGLFPAHSDLSKFCLPRGDELFGISRSPGKEDRLTNRLEKRVQESQGFPTKSENEEESNYDGRNETPRSICANCHEKSNEGKE